ncbi:hypothetical protein [Alicyclobacillus sp. SO9]|uniref:hypothetical protein n=1 Tax=Alicyclobacillus sp. SO9 TaxID=2665646 RepID=UPI0018E8D2AB|nr:hypothetical protein [Alicyclobacillus sp. SO9]QQE78737.1 hypothetical protein GI364_23290 [Alicyclobacillus sp. SO9]
MKSTSSLLTSSVRNTRFLFVAAIACVLFVAAAVYNAHYLSVLPFVLLAFVIIYLDSYISLVLLLSWIAVQNTLIPAMYSAFGGGSTMWLVILSMSELTAIILLAVRLLRTINVFDLRSAILISTFVLVVATLVVFTLHRGSSLFSAVYNLRTVFIPMVFLFLGYLYFFSRDEMRRVLVSVSVLSTIGAVFGLIDALFLGRHFWAIMHMGNYWINVKHLPKGYLYRGLPGNFYENYGGQLLRRVVSIYGDPLAAGYSMAIGFGAALFARDFYRSKALWLGSVLIILLAVALTYTRAAYIMVFVEFLFYYFYRRKIGKPISKWLFIALIGILFVAATKVIISTITLQNGSTLIHLHAFLQIPAMFGIPFGHGVGASGGPEGAYLEIWWQFGLPILAAFVWWLIEVFLTIDRIPYNFYMGAAIVVSLVITGVISQEMLTDTAASIGWILIGMTLSGTDKLRKLKRGYKEQEGVAR